MVEFKTVSPVFAGDIIEDGKVHVAHAEGNGLTYVHVKSVWFEQ